MGDDWRRTITVETVSPGEPDVKYPRASSTGKGAARPRMPAACPASRCSSIRWPTLTTKNTTAAIAIRRHAGKVAYRKSRP